MRNDDFIPDRLQRQLTRRHEVSGLPEVTLSTALAGSDRLLQLADLVTSAVRQRYLPSGNPLKAELAGDIADLTKDLGTGGNRRIRPFEWKPRTMLPTTD